MFPCQNGECIPFPWKCDGEYDCLDRSDELECKGKWRWKNFPHKSWPNYLRKEFMYIRKFGSLQVWKVRMSQDMTRSLRKCIWVKRHIYLFCIFNYVVKSSTEFEDMTAKCNKDDHLCDGVWCIHSTWLCDGETDCRDGSDERNCGTELTLWAIDIEVSWTLNVRNIVTIRWISWKLPEPSEPSCSFF